MRIRSGENREELVQSLKGGNGTVKLHHFMELPDFHGAGRLFSYTVLEPGCTVGYHRHDVDFEAYYILKGHGSYNDNGDVYEVGPGDFLLCRPGESHALENGNKENIEYIALILFVQN